MDKMKMETVNQAKENMEKIAQLFPNCVTEAEGKDGELKKAIDFDKLKQMMADYVREGEEAYEFTWVGKKAAIIEANRPIRKTLRPCIEISKNWDTTENLYIEGDNLEALKLLQESYLARVKMIYIDPPYNTGNDFVYKDNFKQNFAEYEEDSGIIDDDGNRMFINHNTDGRFHSKWCSMLYSRLLLSRGMLKSDGVIVVNIDEHEYENLIKLLDEVFGEDNNLGTIIWDKRNPKGDAHGISYQHEYIVLYCKNKEEFKKQCKLIRPKKNANIIIKKAKTLFKKSNNISLEEINKEFNQWIKSQDTFSGGERAYNKIDENGDVYRPVSMGWPNKKKAPDDYFKPLMHPITKKYCPVPSRGWRNPSDTMKRLEKEGRILFGKDETTIPNSKYLLKDNMYENIPSLLYYGGSDTALMEMLDIPFDTPKSVDVCMEHINSLVDDDDIVMDFFSGSSTTAHAVMKLNSIDDKNRKFIMVQVPELVEKNSIADKKGYHNLCEIGIDRIRKSGDIISQENDKVDVGFRVLKIDESNMNDVYYGAEDYTQDLISQMEDNVKADRTDLDLLFGCLIDWGIPLSLPYSSEKIESCMVHNYNDGDLIACFDKNVSESVVKQIAKMQPMRAVFRDSSFADSSAKINVTEIFKLLAPNTEVRVL